MPHRGPSSSRADRFWTHIADGLEGAAALGPLISFGVLVYVAVQGLRLLARAIGL